MNPQELLYNHLTNAINKLNDLLKNKNVYSFQFKDEKIYIFLN